MEKSDKQKFLDQALVAGLFLTKEEKELLFKFLNTHQQIADILSKGGELTTNMDNAATEIMRKGDPEAWKIVEKLNNFMNRDKRNE